VCSSDLVLSSFVSASRVGGGLALSLLPQLRTIPVLAPTTLFGRHPGWGPPGGAAVPDAWLESLLAMAREAGAFEDLSAVLIGYLATPGHALIAQSAIAEARRRSPRALIALDAIIGDADTGPYVSPAVEEALPTLRETTDLLACNLWEFRRLTGYSGAGAPQDVACAPRPAGKSVLVTSIAEGERIGAVFSGPDGAFFSAAPAWPGPPVRGAGDVLKLIFLARLAAARPPGRALASAVGLTAELIRQAAAVGSAELSPVLPDAAPEASLRTLAWPVSARPV